MELKQLILSWGEGRCLTKYWLYLMFVKLHDFPFLGIFYFLTNIIYSYIISFRMFGFSVLPRVSFPEGTFKISIHQKADSKIKFQSELVIIFERWGSGAATRIILEKDSIFSILDTFVIGDGCKIFIAANAELVLYGKSEKQLSGITCDSIILCANYVSIGRGTILSWGCYLSDSSQHRVNGVVKVSPIVIGDHVWISEGVTCVVGCKIGAGSIVGAKSYVNKQFPDSVFLAGAPARIMKGGITWSR